MMGNQGYQMGNQMGGMMGQMGNMMGGMMNGAANVANMAMNQAGQMMMGGAQMMMDPMLQQKFMMLDRDRSGHINVREIAQAYQQFEFPVQSAKMLLQAVSDMPFLDMNSFPLFDKYINSFYQAFSMVAMGNNRINAQQAQQAIMTLQFPQVTPQNLMALINKYDTDRDFIEFGEFMAICAYMLICSKLMSKFDGDRNGRLEVDYNGLVSLGIWFI